MDHAPVKVNSHPTKRSRGSRVRVACLSCRRRKVRCDLTLEGHTCTNCRLDGFQCLPASTRASAKSATRPKRSAMPSSPSKPVLPRGHLNSHTTQLPTSPSTPLQMSCHVPNASDNRDLDMGGHCTRQPNGLATGNKRSTSKTHSMILMPYSHYPYLSVPNLCRLPPADVAYLESQQAFHVPAGDFLDTLISHYFLSVHPCLPIVNEAEFWKMYRHAPAGSSCSLLLFQAMLFAASSYIPLNEAKAAGADSILRMRDSFYRRAKLLYDFRVEDDCPQLCQSAILLSYHCSSENRRSNTSWLAVAIDHARTLNAHHYYCDSSHVRASPAMLKRLWWCIVIRDTLLALGMRRPLQIPHSVFNSFSWAPLQLEDFEDEIHASEVYDPYTKMQLCGILTSLCHLAVAMTMLLTTLYPDSGYEGVVTDHSLLLSRAGDIKARLNYWEANDMVLLSPETACSNPAVKFYQQLTFLYCESARLALYHQLAFLSSIHKGQESTSSRAIKVAEKDQPNPLDALSTINERVRRFVTDGAASRVPISVVAFTIVPQILLNIGLRLSCNTTERRQQEQTLRFYHELSRSHTLRYDVAYVSSWVQQTISMFDSSASLEMLSGAPERESGSATRLRKTLNPKQRFLHLLESQPWVYFRLVSLIDYSMSTGQRVLEQIHPPRILPSPGMSYPRTLTQWPSFPKSAPWLLPNNESEVREESRSLAASPFGGIQGGIRRAQLEPPLPNDTELLGLRHPLDFSDSQSFGPLPARILQSPSFALEPADLVANDSLARDGILSGYSSGVPNRTGSSDLDNLWVELGLLGE